jgi:hypothetical protein
MLLGGYYKTFDSICTTDVETNILQIPGVFLVFGKYRIVITVSPVNFPRATTVKQIDLLILPLSLSRLSNSIPMKEESGIQNKSYERPFRIFDFKSGSLDALKSIVVLPNVKNHMSSSPAI